MPRITPKSPELLFAQAAAYATERDDSENRHEMIRTREDIFSMLARVATHDNDFSIVEDKDLYTNHYDKYVGYLRAIKGSSNEVVQRRLNLSLTFEEFRQQFDELLELRKSIPYHERQNHPSFLGSGESSTAWKIEKDDKSYAVRFSRMLVETDSRVSADLVGTGIPRLEHLSAISYKDRVTIAEIVSGRSTSVLSESQMNSISEEQLQALLGIVMESFKSGVSLDPNTNNFRYDPEAGFGIIDYHSQASPLSGMRTISISEAIRMATIDIGGIGNRTYGNGLPNFYATGSQLDAAKGVLVKYRRVVEGAEIPRKEKQIALAEIDKALGEYSPERLAERQAHYEHHYPPKK